MECSHPRKRSLFFALVLILVIFLSFSGGTIRVSQQPIAVVRQSSNTYRKGPETEQEEENANVKEKVNLEEKVESIAFLFLSSKQMDEDMWSRWFPPKEDGRYSIHVHSKNQEEIPLGPFFCPYAIPAVSSAWGHLHGAMMQLLHHAYFKYSRATKFVFVGDTSIPLLSFEEFYRTVKSDGEKSLVCVMGQEGNECAKRFFAETEGLRDVNNGTLGAKAELWSRLSRRHVEQLISDRPTMDSWKSIIEVKSKNNFVGKCGATDEVFIPSLLLHRFNMTEFVQGKCTHKVFWSLGAGNTSCTRVLDNCRGHRPYSSKRFIKEEGLQHLRDEGYLMLRKVRPGSVMQTKTEKFVKLSDGLLLFHQRQSLDSLNPFPLNSTKQTDEKTTFACIRPKSFAS